MMATILAMLSSLLILSVYLTIGCIAFNPIYPSPIVFSGSNKPYCCNFHQYQICDGDGALRYKGSVLNYSLNDYFSSFNTNSDNDEEDNSINKSEDDTSKGNYIGGGRLDQGSSQDSGGAFDVNSYFNNFNNQDSNTPNYNDDDTEDEQEIQEEEHQQPPQIKMSYEEMVQYNNARLCPKLFLTQCALQSFLYLLEECRDPHSGKWIEDYLGLQNLLNYHGTGAINITNYPTWDTPLYDIMNEPNTKMIISAKRRGRGHGGWSKNNPYLQERWVEFTHDIRPASLVQRLLPVRLQLASEFEIDLQIVEIVNQQIMTSYMSNLRFERDEPILADMAGIKTDVSQSKAAFDRISVEILSNHIEYQESSSSPFRKGNFDLLYSLCTQASAHRLLRELQSSATSDTDITYQWFKEFYIENVPLYFDGDQRFGRADEFLDTLLNSSPSLIDRGNSVGLIDPLSIAERILAIRSEIVQEWIQQMQQVDEDHTKMNDKLFRVVMDRTINASGSDMVVIEEETTFDDLPDSAGEFQ